MAQRTYFDHAATSPMPRSVREAYTEALVALVGNPASQHGHGQDARDMLESAREVLARYFGVTAAEIVFTSGGTEAINLALKGIFWARNKAAFTAENSADLGVQERLLRPIILAAMGEHHATLDTLEWLAQYQGAQIVWLPLDSDGVLQASVLAAAIDEAGAENIALATVLLANNEIGSVNPVAQLHEICLAHDIPLHTDAVAALGQFHFKGDIAEAISISAHKIGGPVSSGALILSRNTKIEPLLHGGSQQRARSGTQDAAAATVFAAALQAATADFEAKQARLAAVQNRLIDEIRKIDPQAVLRGAKPDFALVLDADFGSENATESAQAAQNPAFPPRIPGNVHFTFPGCQGDSLLFLLDQAGISVSTGSACTAGVIEVSHVMRAIGLPDEIGIGALRFTFNAATSDAEIDHLLAALPAAIAAARQAGLS
ncbi:MAG: cysteine desulfurase family protein [Microbacteriaceae bacterium]|nr:cysteine desulfurase family protein [Microbacteriaceae bacterium]